MKSDLITIREMCELFDVTPRTLRFYESKELLSPIRQGQKRLYTRRDRGRLKLILRGKRFGFSLEDIRQLLDLYDLGDEQKTQIRRTIEVARERLAEMRRQRAELDSAIDELAAQIAEGEQLLTDNSEHCAQAHVPGRQHNADVRCTHP
ncbi:HTH-type transcriptional regulator ZntR [Defluviimonas aquaemixtae]|uniref:HTH-type transcriptional regulator ZntR n=1 Tax=Albidovulum aquaemixtae TaxID=1542388 RepID=A0A2R8B3P9_9RHOB|nr:MerR family DNA-binding transcriptional regulator [Defluviimonas aquaemixtae]SPH17150.1 HTH-type transcriptional regulator ZntR [Defluviimonas aquaemixtae]